MKECWDERYLFRKVQGKDGEWQYYAYVLEAVLVFANGMVLPLPPLQRACLLSCPGSQYTS